MNRMRMTPLVALCVLLAAAPVAAATPEEACEIAKNKAAGAYAACRQKAEAKALQRGEAPAYAKCDAKFQQSWSKAEAKVAKKGAACVDGLESADLQALLGAQADLTTTLLGGAEGVTSADITAYLTQRADLVELLLTQLDPQCLQPYRTLDLANRNVSAAVGATPLCDGPSGTPDVQWLGTGWYRFREPAGTQLPESPPDGFFCGTDAAGWLNGTHPTPEEGIVSREACFSIGGDPCGGGSGFIEVLNCQAFFLYKLVDITACNYRYCAE
jgi:hypothetical protein